MKLVVFLDYLRKGGTERQAMAVANEAMRRGHQVTFLTIRPGGPFKGELKAPHVALQPFDTGIDEWAPGLESVLKKISPGIVLCMGRVTNRMIKKLKRWVPKVVATFRTGKRVSRERLLSYGAADMILTNSLAWQNILMTMDCKTRIETVGNSLLMNPVPDDAARMLLRKKMGARADTVVVLCFQRLTPRKGQHVLMENFMCAAHDLDAQLWIVGKGWVGWLLGLYARVLGPGRIKVMPPEFPVSYYYNAADAVATVSHEDSLPNFLIEAHAFGLPGICEDYAGCGEVIVGGITGFVVSVDNDAGYAVCLRQLILAPLLRKFLGDNARNLSFRFSHKKQMGRFIDLLEEVCRK